MDADRPVTSRDHDRLGFAPIAEQLATVITDKSAQEGLVFGIEGAWGSGKSSIISLTKESLRNRQNGPEIVDFAPWLVGARDTLLGALFGELAAAAVKIDPLDEAIDELAEPPPKWRKLLNHAQNDALWKLKKKQAFRKKIGRQLDTFGAVAGVVGKTGVPVASHVGKAIEETIKLFSGDQSLAKQKGRLVDALRKISRSIVVFVDDLDRLEPREAAEVLRLIRAVADFPNVTYILSYDPKVIAKTLEKAVQVDDGAAYLEKIVQASFRVPRPQAFDLRFWFKSEVENLFATILDQIDARRLSESIDVQGGQYLSTPRDVVRALNALRLHALPVLDKIDIPDMVWLQLTRIGMPGLYVWIEEYMKNVAAIYGGGQISNEEAQHTSERLNQLLSRPGADPDLARIRVGTIIPGLGDEFQFGREQRRPIYNNLGLGHLAQFIRARRLGSPEHFRYYFAFAEPAGALADDVLNAFLAAAENEPATAAHQFHELMGQNRPQGGTMAEVLMDPLIAVAILPLGSAGGIIGALAQHMDKFADMTGQMDMGRPRAWPRGESLIDKLFKAAPPDERPGYIDALFTGGQSLGWITSVLRSEIFAHGHFGGRPEPPDQWLLTEAEFAEILPAMLQRYQVTEPNTLLKTPQIVSLLFAWSQGGQNEAARNWVAGRIQTNRGLLDFLSRARGWGATNGHVYFPLRRQELANFLDYDDALERLREIADAADTSEEDRRLAHELLQAAQEERD